MTAGRLTKTIRESIVRKATNEAFQKERDALLVEEHKIGLTLYKSVFDKKVLTAVNKLPKTWLRMDDCLRFNSGGMELRFDVKPAVPVPSERGYCQRLGTLTPEMADVAQAFANKKEDAVARYNRAKRELMALLDSVSTFKKLKEVWPEGADYYTTFDVERTITNVPAVVVSEINKMLGISTNQSKEKENGEIAKTGI